jgi:hypothetical protein
LVQASAPRCRRPVAQQRTFDPEIERALANQAGAEMIAYGLRILTRQSALEELIEHKFGGTINHECTGLAYYWDEAVG